MWTSRCVPPSQVPPSAPPPPPRTAESCYNKLADHEWCYEAGANTQGACEAYFFEKQYGCDASRTQTSERSPSLGNYVALPILTHNPITHRTPAHIGARAHTHSHVYNYTCHVYNYICICASASKSH